MNKEERNTLYIIMYKRYLLDMLMRSSEEHINLEVMTEAEFVKMKSLCELIDNSDNGG